MRRKWTSQKGAAAVEFALVLIPLILIVFGAIEFGVLLFDKQVITNASREGARAGIVAKTCNYRLDLVNDSVTCDGTTTARTGIKTIVDNYAKTHLITFGNSPALKIKTLPSDPKGTSLPFGDGNTLTVTVEYDYSFLVIPNFIPGIAILKTLTATTVMKYE